MGQTLNHQALGIFNENGLIEVKNAWSEFSIQHF